jgi:diadenosine tetraphosphatase ApaH/serine/threonine PP2A family protein phosphatase
MPADKEPQLASPPPDTRIYAVGDVHGRADLLGDLHKRIARDADKASETRRVIVYLGDYVDRGPDSAGVIDRLIDSPLEGFEAVFLMGNHEQFLLDFLSDPSVGAHWLGNGGDATLASYGVDVKGSDPVDMAAVAALLRKILPAEHLAFLEGLALSHREGDYFFAHAGIRPGVPLDKQSEDDLLWIREPFLDVPDAREVVVVHGHTPVKVGEVHDNRIAVDTGAVWSDRLTAAVLHEQEQSFIHT